MQNNQLSYSK